MARSGSVIDIPTRLEEPGRFLMLEHDEFMVLVLPVFFGFLTQHLIPGILVGGASYFFWSRIKGDQGFYALWSLLYWWLPHSVSGLKSLPDSAVVRWSA